MTAARICICIIHRVSCNKTHFVASCLKVVPHSDNLNFKGYLAPEIADWLHRHFTKDEDALKPKCKHAK